MCHERHAGQNTLDLRDDVIVDLLREFPPDRWLKGTEMTMRPQSSQQHHLLSEDLMPRRLELISRRGSVLEITQSIAQPELDRRMHAAVELGQHEQTSDEELAKLGFGGYWVGEDYPEEGDCAASCYSGEFVGAEKVDWVVGLTVGFGCADAEFADLSC